MYCKQRILTIFGGAVGNFMLHFFSHFFFNFENLSSHHPWCSKYSEFSKTPPTFAFWISLKVVMAVFPQKDIFFRHPVYANQTKCISEFGDVFYNGLYILGPKTFKKLPFLLCHIYGQHCRIRLKMERLLENNSYCRLCQR